MELSTQQSLCSPRTLWYKSCAADFCPCSSVDTERRPRPEGRGCFWLWGNTHSCSATYAVHRVCSAFELFNSFLHVCIAWRHSLGNGPSPGAGFIVIARADDLLTGSRSLQDIQQLPLTFLTYTGKLLLALQVVYNYIASEGLPQFPHYNLWLTFLTPKSPFHCLVLIPHFFWGYQASHGNFCNVDDGAVGKHK